MSYGLVTLTSFGNGVNSFGVSKACRILEIPAHVPFAYVDGCPVVVKI
jgi:hypothetical protein